MSKIMTKRLFSEISSDFLTSTKRMKIESDMDTRILDLELNLNKLSSELQSMKMKLSKVKLLELNFLEAKLSEEEVSEAKLSKTDEGMDYYMPYIN